MDDSERQFLSYKNWANLASGSSSFMQTKLSTIDWLLAWNLLPPEAFHPLRLILSYFWFFCFVCVFFLISNFRCRNVSSNWSLVIRYFCNDLIESRNQEIGVLFSDAHSTNLYPGTTSFVILTFIFFQLLVQGARPY